MVGEHTPESRMGIHPERGGAPATVSKGRSMTDTPEMVGGVRQREYIYNMIKKIESSTNGYYRITINNTGNRGESTGRNG